MINEKVKAFLDEKSLGDRLTEHTETIDTVEHAAQQIGCSEPEIAKTLSFVVDEKPVVVVMAGDGKVNSSKFKTYFHTKPHMIPRDQVQEITGFQPGGVCPFAVPDAAVLQGGCAGLPAPRRGGAGTDGRVSGAFRQAQNAGNEHLPAQAGQAVRPHAGADRGL